MCLMISFNEVIENNVIITFIYELLLTVIYNNCYYYVNTLI